MKIEDYAFGRIRIDGTEHQADVIVHNEGVLPKWWRKEGHKLAVEDLKEVVEQFRPEIVVVGRGKFGMMKISPEVEKYMHDQAIELEAATTGKAVEIFNRLVDTRRVLGAFHLTC